MILGSGVFGSLAAAELRARGHAVRLASRSTGVDATSEASVLLALDKVDALLHTAGPFLWREPGAARAAARVGIPYADISDDRAFSAGVRAVEAHSPLLTGMSTTPAVAEALTALVRARSPTTEHGCAMYVGGANKQGPATMEFAARSRKAGLPIRIRFPGIGRRSAYPARAFYDGEFYVAVGGIAGLGWRSRPLLRALAPYASRFPRVGSDTAGALVAYSGDAREAIHAREGGQRLAVLPAVWALEEAFAGRAPRRAALPTEWVEPEKLLGFLEASGFERLNSGG